jgi:EAL domain-containing protein (putative c-di-GMP-specific phosphodiesterase class I)/AmiR/NasT family two-component response regulator
MSRVRVLIADDEPMVLEALAQLIREEETLELVGAAGDADQAIELAAVAHPDVALLDVKMPRGGGARAAREIRATEPLTRVLALSAHEDRTTVLEMLRAGAMGYLVKGARGADILKSIRRCALGQASLSTAITADIIRELARQFERPDADGERVEDLRDQILMAARGSGLMMVFQPIVELGTGRIAGLEALARFALEPKRSTTAWFEEASEIGLLSELELTAARMAVANIHRLPPGVFMSVNVSPSTAASPDFVQAACSATSDRLVIEVTEHARVDDYEALNEALGTIRDAGVRLAIDDAGAGFASLQHVVRLSPDFIKLDMALTRGIDADPVRRALATAMISFAGEAGATFIAEGIETPAEYETLRSLGATCGQGYYLALPAPLPQGGFGPAAVA